MAGVVCLLFHQPLLASDADLAQDLSNPIADLITLPVQMNYDQDIGVADGNKLQTNIQPVIPFGLAEDWNLITRTIVPVTNQEDIFPGAGSQFGLGDTSLTLFLSPKSPTSTGILWGAGPIFLLADGNRIGTRLEEMGSRSERSSPYDAGTLDDRTTRESYLVVCR